MRLVEEEDEHRLLGIAEFRQPLEELGQHPQKERRVQLRRANQFIGDEDVDHPAAVRVGLQQIVDVEHRLAEKLARRPAARSRAARAGSRQSTPPRRCRTACVNCDALSPTNCSIARRSFRSSSSRPVIVRDLEDERQHALLRRVQSRADGPAAAGPMSDTVARTGSPRSAEHVPEHHGVRAPGRLGVPGGFEPVAQLRRHRAGRRECPRGRLSRRPETPARRGARSCRPAPAAKPSCRCRSRP